MYRSLKPLNSLLVGVACLLWAMSGYADQTALAPAIGGYSPVSYFTKQRAEKGRPEFSVEHKGKVYWLASREQVEQFSADPDRYRPRYDVCPYSLALGKRLPLDPTNFKIVAGSLLLFHRSDQTDGLKGFESSGLSDKELVRRADANFLRLSF